MRGGPPPRAAATWPHPGLGTRGQRRPGRRVGLDSTNAETRRGEAHDRRRVLELMRRFPLAPAVGTRHARNKATGAALHPPGPEPGLTRRRTAAGCAPRCLWQGPDAVYFTREAKERAATQELVFTKHAEHVMAERGLDEEFIRRAVTSPDLVQHQPDGTTHYLRMSPEHGGRWLRVVTVESGPERKVVTAFLDRRLGRGHAHQAGS